MNNLSELSLNRLVFMSKQQGLVSNDCLSPILLNPLNSERINIVTI